MNPKLMTLAIVLFTLVGLPTLFAQDAAAGTVTGYLSDSLCGKAGYPEGYKGVIDLVKDASDHAGMCLNMDNCRAAGYGVFVKEANGKYKYVKFDAKGSALAYDKFIKPVTDKMAKTPAITVKGKLKDGVYTVTSIELATPIEKPSAKTNMGM
jgi:hypothetical protein